MTDRTTELRDDSAKKLEEDVIGRATLSYYGDGTIRLDSSYMDRASLADVFDWLDRRSLITKRITELKANDGTRWYELFGTPGKAARTLIAVRGVCESGPCSPNCPFSGAPVCPSSFEPSDYDALLEWLESEVRDD